MEVPNIASTKAYTLAHSPLVPHMTNTFPIFPSRVFFFATLRISYSRDQNSLSNSGLKIEKSDTSLLTQFQKG